MNRPAFHLASSFRWLAMLLLALAAACSRPAPRLAAELERTTPWDPELLRVVGETPLQNEGRIMPLSSLASFTLYAVHGRRDVQFTAADGHGGDQLVKLSPTEWVLDLWSYPAQAEQYPLFRIENVRVLEQLGFPHEEQTSGFEYLTYAQLWQQRLTLRDLAGKYQKKPALLQDEVEGQIVQLWRQFIAFSNLHRNFSELQQEIPLEGDELRTLFDGHDRTSLAEILDKATAFRDYVTGIAGDVQDPKHGNLDRVLAFLNQVAQSDPDPAFLPPTRAGKDDAKWLTVGDVVNQAMSARTANSPKGADPAHLLMVRSLQAAMLGADHTAREKGWLAYHDAVDKVAHDRPDTARVATESYYYRANWHFHAMMTFLLGFLIAVVCWAVPKNRLLWWASMGTTALGLCLLTADVWLRCLVTGHPPIARLYDTFLFIAGVSALTLMIAEFVMPRRIALALAPFLGCLLVFFGRLYEVVDGRDTMEPLQAVLLSNFWLAVHVPTINIGYASGMAAALVGATWLVMRVLRLSTPDTSLMKSLVRMGYGVVCFSLATSVVGTILGGVWANDSWGRFWGWDTKENGALLICLSQIALLHARMTGMVRDAGFMLWSTATGMVVLFSWFHVNLLQVGLHAYGFSPHMNNAVWTGYTVFAATLVAGGLDVWLRPNPVAADGGIDDFVEVVSEA